MTYRNIIRQKLIAEVLAHKGFGESANFYILKEEIVSKLGEKAWEKLLREAKLHVVDIQKKEKKND